MSLWYRARRVESHASGDSYSLLRASGLDPDLMTAARVQRLAPFPRPCRQGHHAYPGPALV